MKLNRYTMGVLREEAGDGGDGGGGGTPPADPPPSSTPSLTAPPSGDAPPAEFKDWKANLSDEFKTNPSLADFKDSQDGLNALAKSYIHTKQMVGTDKVAKLTESSTPEEVDAFFKSAGKPETADDYKFEVPELTNIQVDENKLGDWKKTFHELNLTQNQANALIGKYLSTMDASTGEMTAVTDAEVSKGISQIQEEWGDNFDGNIDMAKAAVKQFGGEEFAKYLDQTGASAHPLMIKFAHNVAKAIMDDHPAGDGKGLIVTSKTQAQQELKSLKADPAFQKLLTNKNAPGHKDATKRWDELHNQAYSE